METTWNALTPKQQEFFAHLKKWLNVKPYFFGSIQRFDYVPGVSDIDVDIFSTNPELTAYKLSNMFTGTMFNFYRINWSFDNSVVSGYKVKYKGDPERNFKVEFSIYGDSDKDAVLKKHRSQINIPFYYSLLLLSMKLLMYRTDAYYRWKRWLLSPEDEFTAV